MLYYFGEVNDKIVPTRILKAELTEPHWSKVMKPTVLKCFIESTDTVADIRIWTPGLNLTVFAVTYSESEVDLKMEGLMQCLIYLSG